MVDVQTDKIVNTLSFKSETGMPQYDPVAKLIYVNLQELDTMTVIDPATDKVKTPDQSRSSYRVPADSRK